MQDKERAALHEVVDDPGDQVFSSSALALKEDSRSLSLHDFDYERFYILHGFRSTN